jgi:hypothetical protein
LAIGVIDHISWQNATLSRPVHREAPRSDNIGDAFRGAVVTALVIATLGLVLVNFSLARTKRLASGFRQGKGIPTH